MHLGNKGTFEYKYEVSNRKYPKYGQNERYQQTKWGNWSSMDFIRFFSAFLFFCYWPIFDEKSLVGIAWNYKEGSWTLLGTEITITNIILNALMLKQVLGQITKPVTLRTQVQELVEGKFEYIY